MGGGTGLGEGGCRGLHRGSCVKSGREPCCCAPQGPSVVMGLVIKVFFPDAGCVISTSWRGKECISFTGLWFGGARVSLGGLES